MTIVEPPFDDDEETGRAAEANNGRVTEQSDSPALPASSSPFVPPRRRLLAAGSLLVLFLLAFLGSRTYRGPAHLHNDAADPTREPAQSPSNKPGDPADLLERGDQALQQFRFAAALWLYAEVLEARPSDSPFIDYRLGLCHESLGLTDKAVAAYRKAISAAPSPAFSFACQLGLARCLLRQDNPIHARQLLYPMLFDEDRQQALPAEFIADARYLTALAVGQETNTAKSDRPSADDLASFRDVRMEIPFYFEELASVGTAPVPRADEKKTAAALTVQKGDDKQPSMVVQARDRGDSAAETLERLVTAGGMRAEWSEEAKRRISDRALPISVQNWTLRSLVESAADHCDLACDFADDTVRFTTRAEADKHTLIRLSRGMRQRALQDAILHDDDNPLTPAAHLELGNEFAADEKFADAATCYERVTTRFPASPAALLGLYNRASLHVREKELPLARRMFLRVIDCAPGHEFSLRAYLRLGRLCVADEEVSQAIIYLRRAQSLAPQSSLQPLVALALAAAHLQAGEQANARAVLAKHRHALNKDPYRNAALFIDVYANYRLAKGAGAARREAADLLSTFETEPIASPLGFPGEWLMFQAYRDLGLSDEAERVLRQAAAHAHGPLGDRISLALGELMARRNPADQGLFIKLAESSSRYAAHAQLERMRFDLREKRFQSCADKCRQLWTNESFSERNAVLQLWGAALEGLGDFAKAAQCYAGKAPE